MPRLTPEDASLILDHVVGDQSAPTAAARALLAALPFPSRPTPRLLRSVLLRRVASDPVSSAALDSFQLLAASLPSTDAPVAAAHLAVAAFLAASAPDFDAAARALFARPNGRARRPVEEGGDPALVSGESLSVADQFEAAIGNAVSQDELRKLWGNRAMAEERVRELLEAQWAVIGPSLLELAAEQIAGEGAVETWRAAEEATRAKYRMLVGEERAQEILCKLEEPTYHITSPQVHNVIDALKSSCADLHLVVDDPLPAAKAAAEALLVSRMDKAVDTTKAAADEVLVSRMDKAVDTTKAASDEVLVSRMDKAVDTTKASSDEVLVGRMDKAADTAKAASEEVLVSRMDMAVDTTKAASDKVLVGTMDKAVDTTKASSDEVLVSRMDMAVDTAKAASDEVLVGTMDKAVDTTKASSDEVLVSRMDMAVDTAKAASDEVLVGTMDKAVDTTKASSDEVLVSRMDMAVDTAKAASDEVLVGTMDKAVDTKAEKVLNQPENCGTSGSSALNDKGKCVSRELPTSLMDRNSTAQTFQWEDSSDPEGSPHRPHLPSPRRVPVSPLHLPDNKGKRRRPRKWSVAEEEALKKGVEQFGRGSWKDVLINNHDLFIGRTAVDLKDKWRNMMR